MIYVEQFTGIEEEWDTFALAQKGFTHFHRLRWRSVMERVFGHDCVYLAARDESDDLIGILPLVRVRSRVFGHYLVSMPFVNSGGPLGTAEGVRALSNEAVSLATFSKVKLLEMRSRVPLDISLPVSHRKITVLLPLPGSKEALMKGFDQNLRRKIRKRQKIGVTVSFGHQELEPFYGVFAQNMRDLGTPTHSLGFFREIAEQFQDDCWFACAYLDGIPVAGGCGFTFGGEFEMTWASSLRSYHQQAPNLLLYYACMERSIEQGLTQFNFGRCTPDSGSHRFKTQWGGHDEPLWWYDFATSTNAITPSPDQAAFRWGPRIWRKIPVSIATRVGPSIVRYLP
jgi:FemAB-related protein (PEP-CTERM system-associated)